MEPEQQQERGADQERGGGTDAISLTRVLRGAEPFVRREPVPGRRVGYCATPQPQMTAATPRTERTRSPRTAAR